MMTLLILALLLVVGLWGALKYGDTDDPALAPDELTLGRVFQLVFSDVPLAIGAMLVLVTTWYWNVAISIPRTLWAWLFAPYEPPGPPPPGPPPVRPPSSPPPVRPTYSPEEWREWPPRLGPPSSEYPGEEWRESKSKSPEPETWRWRQPKE